MRIPRWLRVTALALGFLYAGVMGMVWLVLRNDDDRAAQCRGYERFFAGTWRDSSKAFGPRATRGCIVDDLLATHDFRGQRREEIVRLLGQPSPAGDFGEWKVVYWLEPDAANVDSRWLAFRFDTLGRVVEARVIED